MKRSLCVSIDFLKPITLDKTTSYFTSSMETISRSLTSEEYYSYVDQIMTQINIFCTGGSGWVFDQLKSLDVEISKYNPYFLQHISRLQRNWRVWEDVSLTLKFWAIAFVSSIVFWPRSFHVRKNQQRPSSYRSHFDDLNFNKRIMPMPLSAIPAFEKKINLAVIFYGLNGNEIFPVHLTKQRSVQITQINLSILSNDQKAHYCFIKNVEHEDAAAFWAIS